MIKESIKNQGIERGKRLKAVRGMAGVTLTSLSEQANIPIDTLKTWESANRKTSLTEAGAYRMVEAFTNMGLKLTAEWLLYGYGPHPLPSHANIIDEHNAKVEADYFYTHVSNATYITVKDDAMQPYFCSGDLVGGCWQPIDAIDCKENEFFIIESKTLNAAVCRRLIRADTGNYHALAINPNSTCQPLTDISLSRAAAVTRLWRD